MSSYSVVRLSLIFCYVLSIFLTTTDAMSCKGSAEYKLTFKGEWTQQSHPEDFPPIQKFSDLVGCSHNASYVMWQPRMNATTAVKNVTETGSPTALNGEIDQQIASKKALARFNALNIRTGTGNTSVGNIPVNTQYPLVSAISRINPSPDWFVGVHDYSLCNQTTGKWIDKRVKDLFLYDAGTDSALRFVHKGTPTIPPVPILLLNTTTKRFGTFTFVKTSDNSNAAGPPEMVNIASFLMLITLNLLVSFHLV